jgi:hypothetical protein
MQAAEPDIKVIYCGGWGYRPKYELLKASLKNKGVTNSINGYPTEGRKSQI